MNEKERSAKTLALVNYILYAVSFLVGITAVVALIINYVKKDEVAGTWLASHFRWQIRTFWFGLLWAVVGFILFSIGMAGSIDSMVSGGSFSISPLAILFPVAWVIFIADAIWVLYRLIKGFLKLNDNQPIGAT